MARQRLNTGFAIKFGCASLLAVGSVYGLLRFRKPHNPAPYIAAGDEAMKRYDYLDASQDYAVASEMLPQDEPLHLKLGRCYYELVHAGLDDYQNAVTEFTRAEELKPDDAEAWVGLLEINEYQVQRIESRAKDQRLRQELSLELGMMRDAAAHLKALKPDSIQALSAGPILTIRTWIMNLTLPDTAEDLAKPADKRQTTDQKAEAAIAELTKLMADHPENEKIPYWIARAKIFQAQQAQRSERPEQAPALFDEASRQFDADIAARPDVVGLYISKASILTMLRDLDNSPNSDYRKRLKDTLEVAQGLVDPVKSPPDDYERAKVQWAENLRLTDVTGAEDVYRHLIEHFPDHIMLRIQLARLLEGSGHQQDALAVLDSLAKVSPPPVTDIGRRAAWDEQMGRAKLVRANIEIDQMKAASPGPERDRLVKDINASIDAAQKRFAGTPELLRVLGRFQMANGQRRDAIDTLTAAAEKMYAMGGVPDFFLLRDEAQAYEDGGQTNKAVELLESKMIDPILANNNEMHLTLAQMNLRNQDYGKAKPYIDWLAQRLPDEPQVVYLEIQELGPNPDWSLVDSPDKDAAGKGKSLWKKLPETQPGDIALKATLASQLHNNDEAIRLWSMVNKDNPGDVSVAIKLASCYQLASKVPDARGVIEECIKHNPDNPTLHSLLTQLDPSATPAQVDADTLEGIAKIKDPFLQQIAYYKFYARHEQPEKEIEHLQKAVQIQPDNKDVLSGLFFIYVENKRFPEAQAMLPHMSELDVDNAHGLILQCRLALAMNDPGSAIIFGRQMTHDMPNFAASWEMYGEALMAQGELNLAAEQFQTALQLQATNVDAMTNLIKCNVGQGKIIAAKSDLEHACARFPDNTFFRDMRQRFMINYDDPEKVLPEITAQLQARPDDIGRYLMDIDALQSCVHARANQGDAQGAQSYQDQARDRFMDALKKWPDDLRFANGLAQLYEHDKDLPNAEKVMKTITERDHWKGQPKPLIMLAQIYLTAGQYDLAEQSLKKALDLQPDSIEALLTLAECKQDQKQTNDALAVLMPARANFSVRVRYTSLLLDADPPRFAEAEYEVSEAMKAQPGNFALTNLMLEVYYSEAARGVEGKRDQGIALATDSINSQHANVFAYLWRAKLLIEGAVPDLDGAVKDLTLFLSSVPTDAEAHRLLARVLDGKHDRDNAIRELETAIKFAPQDKGIRMYLISLYLGASPPRTQDASLLLKATLAMPSFANDPDFDARVALLQAQTGENDKAIATMQKALSEAKNKDALLPDYFSILLMTKNYDLLNTETSKYIAKDPNCPPFIHADCGLAKSGLGDAAGADAEFKTALKRAGTEKGSGAASAVASTIASAPKPLGPAKALELVLPLADSSTSWQIVAAELYLANQDRVGALKEVELAMTAIDTLPPADQFHLLELASNVYLTTIPPMVDKALAVNRKLLVMQPTDINALNDIACILVDMSSPPDPVHAMEYSQKAYDLSNKMGNLEPRVADTQGWVMIENNKVEDGIALLHKAVEIHVNTTKSDFPEAHYHLAVGYEKIKEPSAARTELGTAQRLVQQLQADHQPVDPDFVKKIDAELSKVTRDGSGAP